MQTDRQCQRHVGAGGINTWSLGRTAGRVGLDDKADQLADAVTAQTQGNFPEWTASLACLQSLGQANTLYLVLD